jgi:hypothetical protein
MDQTKGIPKTPPMAGRGGEPGRLRRLAVWWPLWRRERKPMTTEHPNRRRPEG